MVSHESGSLAQPRTATEKCFDSAGKDITSSDRLVDADGKYLLHAQIGMASQTNIAHTTFLEDCIDKKRTLQDVYEPLGLFSQTVGTRKDPVFVKDEANDLHKSIKEMAQSFKVAYRNDRDRLLADLVKENTFTDQVQELAQSYGHLLWGRAKDRPSRYEGQGAIPDELNWDEDADRDS